MNQPFAPYRLILDRVKTSDLKAPVEGLIRLSDELLQLQAEFPEHVSQNRERREGRRPKLPPSQKRFLERADREASEANVKLERTFQDFPSARDMLRMAQVLEKDSYESYADLYEPFHADEQPMILRMLGLQRRLIEEIEAILSRIP
jgi:hypothetical protein